MAYSSCKVEPPPSGKTPMFSVDGELHPKLREYEYANEILNRSSNSIMLVGSPGTGKTSFVLSLIANKQLLYRCFDCVLIISPSLGSVEESTNPLSTLPEDRFFDSLAGSTMPEILDRVQEKADDGKKTLLILDDLQAELKEKSVTLWLTKLLANRRHLRLTVFCTLQSYTGCPKICRSLFVSCVFFTVGQTDVLYIEEERASLIMNRKQWESLVKDSFQEKYNFLTIKSLDGTAVFRNFDERLHF